MTAFDPATTPPQTILEHLMVQEHLKLANPTARISFGITSRVQIGKADAPERIAIGLDNGNDALKLAMFDDQGQLVTLRVPMAYQTARTIQSGSGELTYRMGRTMFWTGTVALGHDGQDIPAGPTNQRLVDKRWHRIAASSIVELLCLAGFEPGAYDIALGFAIPNTEIHRDEGKGRMGVTTDTATALKEHVRDQQWVVTRIDTRGKEQEWTLNIHEIVPQAQSLGTYLIWAKAPNGKTIKNAAGVRVIDIGGGDLHDTELRFEPYQMITTRIDDGTISIARALIRHHYPDLSLNPIAAQQGLIERKLLMAGQYQPVDEAVDDVLSSEGQNLIGQLLPLIRQSRYFVIITGGGTILLYDMLLLRLKNAGKIAGKDYEMISSSLASIGNAIGALYAILFKAHRRGA